MLTTSLGEFDMNETLVVLIALLCAFVVVLIVLVLSFYTQLFDSELGCCFRRRRKSVTLTTRGKKKRWRASFSNSCCLRSCRSDSLDSVGSSDTGSSSGGGGGGGGSVRTPPPRPPQPPLSTSPSPSSMMLRVGLSNPPSLVSTLTSETRAVQPPAKAPVHQAAAVSHHNPDVDAETEIGQAVAEDPLIRNELNDEGRDHGLGKIRFELTYDWTVRQLTVKICEARGLPAMDFPMGTSDPYCKVSILPDKANRVKTQVRPRKLNPTWNEVFLFENFPAERLLDRTLLIQVLDYDRFSRDDHIGDAQFPLVFLHSANESRRSITLWRYLQPNRKTRGYVGELLLALSYNPHTNQLNLVLMRAKDLKAMDFGRTSDPYCVAKLVHSKTRRVLQRRRSTVARRCLSPQWNESFTFTVPAEKVHEYHLELVVKDKDFLGSETIGRIRLGTRSSPSETAHWTEVLSKPRQQVARWHTLKH